MTRKRNIAKSGTPGVRAHIFNQDCVAGMKTTPNEFFHLGFADPPFNIGFEYDIYHDKKSYEEYMAWCREWLAEMHRVLTSDGSFWLAIGDEYVAELKILAQREIGFHLRSWVIWYYTFGVNCNKKLTRSHAHLLYFTKHKKNFTFNEATLKVPSARQLVYNDKRAKNGGRLPDDTWILRPQWLPDAFASGEDTWQVSRICGTFKERAGTPNQMPEPLLARIINACSNPGDYVLDPFAGSGTTMAVAKKLGRNSQGYELSAEYTAGGNLRLAGIKVGDPLAGATPQGERSAEAS